ncbi:HEPN domain-containing protein [Acinetobacter baumannii]
MLESSIKELCKNNGIDIYPPDSTKPKKLDVLNAALKNADIYNILQQKKITALADIRNNAAHGNIDQFTSEDVKDMIRDIERFLLEYAS